MAGARHHRTHRYQSWAKRITAAARANPRAVCCICGDTAAGHPLGANGKPQRWHAAHTIDGSETWLPWLDVERVPPLGDWLAAGMSRCNIAAGNDARQERRSRDWYA